MNRVVIQIPVTAELRNKAEREAKKRGFGSLQSFIRFMLKKLVENKVDINIVIR